jgi:hypothetical protein
MRRSGRIPKEVPIILIGDDLGGKVFSERTTTVLLSLHGAGILSRHKLSPEQELILRWPEHDKETEIRVVGQLGSNEDLHTYGVAFTDPHLNFWGLEFPPVSAIERELGFLSLVCNSCKTLEKIDDTGLEADICSTNEGVIRFCKRCGSSTFWKPASNVSPLEPTPPTNGQISLFSSPSAKTPAPVPPESSGPSTPVPVFTPSPASTPPQAPARASAYAAYPEFPGDTGRAVLTAPPPEKPAAPRVNRRKHPRVKVSYSACVRHPDRDGDDIVLCEDMSKGGLRFKSRQKYFPQSLIDVAVPYEPGQPAIFVPAQIVYFEELSEQQLFRYGVQYLKPTKTRDAF